MCDEIAKQSDLNENSKDSSKNTFSTTQMPEPSIVRPQVEVLIPVDLVSGKKRSLSDFSEPDIATSSSSFIHNQISYRSIHRNVKLLVKSWGNVVAIHPSIFLSQLLKSRGYDNQIIPFNKSIQMKPTDKRLSGYDQVVLEAVRTSNLTSLREMFESGRSMSACNQFSESIVHLACRRSTPEVVHYILTHISSDPLYDDYGRSILHDACWRPEPRFDVMALLLDHYRGGEVLRRSDVRGAPPLEYVRKEHWVYWCAFLFYMKDKYWPIIKHKTVAVTAVVDISSSE